MYNEGRDFEEHRFQVQEALRVLEQSGYVPSNRHSVLDIGGGQGMHAGFLSESFAKVVCADIIDYTSLYSGEFYSLILAKYSRNGLALDGRKLQFVTSDAMNLIFRDNWFDCCVSFNAFEHIPDPGKALAEIIRVTKKGALSYITFDPIWTCDTGGHFFHRVPQPWAHLLMSDEQYVQHMLQAGADKDEIGDYCHAMNRWRYSRFLDAFEKMVAKKRMEIVFHDEYSAVADESHKSHVNFEAALEKGYSCNELMLRRIRWVVRKL
ncbi:class I SAM-dependent methyltransferase [Burkholderia cenocepacia]|uniref:class I SAM-dependent methyltransferase n=1 Tax=Burkholderia cenocepacia TaxID=95486 RepID=UPI001AA12748|nr:class I SAM-dependent methyltransferase [Burkholderia cenocepacia]MBO1855154.1 class I SAM-dependent methyltransferase [Burkholderia cenocepacia]MDR5641743.1 class I SAM-dependent methyltransferase [Burkholderia cenocepacia]